jgi:hypothetical protein
VTIRQVLRALGGVAAALAGFLPAASPAAEPIRPPVVEYRIAASLDPKSHAVEGRETLLWRNPSGDAVGELRFHLYLNAFKNSRSTFMRESGGEVGGVREALASERPGEWGAIDVLSLKTPAGADLLPRSRTVRPDDNDASDETVLAVPLPSPVPPHGEITLEIGFRSRLPRILARTGYVRDFHLVGQWFPKLGVYEPAGMRGRTAGGWNCHAFHANSEFYADFGDYDVTLTVPAGWIVGATGKRVSEATRDGRTEYRYVQQNVHDFAWACDPRFVVHEYRFEPARDIPAAWARQAASELGEPAAALATGWKPVSIRLLLQPDHRGAQTRYVDGLRAALSFYGLWFGPYPYETLTLVDPPEDGYGSGGMEYPTFITGGTHVRLLHWPLGGTRLTEDVALHEFGHQYFYGMSATNEFEESWLDEGLNTDAEYRAMELAYGPRDFIRLPGGIGVGLVDVAHFDAARLPNLDPIRRFAWKYASSTSYGVNSYSKVGLMLAQLRHDVGAAAYSRAERAFFRQWSFRHPGTSDFFDAMERSLGRDLSAYRRGLVEGTARLDWQVVSASSDRAAGDSGLFDRAGGRVTLDEGAPGSRARRRPGRWTTTILFGNTGDWPHGAKARIAFEDGRVMERRLSGDARWVRLRIDSAYPLAWAVVDPSRENPWDLDRANDSKRLRQGRGDAATSSGAAPAKYLGWAAGITALFTEVLWMLA